MVFALATTSPYTVMVTSEWEKSTLKMGRSGGEAQSTRKMELRSNMTGASD